MIILNTTFHIHDSVRPEVLDWIKRVYTQSALKGGLTDPLLTRIISDADPEGTSFALHLSAPDIATARHWCDGVGASLRRIMSERWKDKALTFHTYLEVVA